jgi:hypothetical protein
LGDPYQDLAQLIQTLLIFGWINLFHGRLRSNAY